MTLKVSKTGFRSDLKMFLKQGFRPNCNIFLLFKVDYNILNRFTYISASIFRNFYPWQLYLKNTNLI
jgi:hypothetical protein